VQAYIEWLSVSGLGTWSGVPGHRSLGQPGEEGLHANSVIPLLRQALERAGIPAEQYTSHSLRRGFATWAHQSGWDLKSLMSYVGWKDMKSAMRYVESTPFAGMSMTAEKRIGS
jgi:integrase